MLYVATRSRFLDELRSEIGTTESPAGSNKNPYAAEAGHGNGYPWCQTFVNAIAKRVGLTLPEGVRRTAYTPTAVNEWKKAGAWHATPAVGDLAYFQFDSDPQVDHVGVVERVNPDGTLVTIEGNTSRTDSGSQSNGGGVFRRVRKPSLVKGFARPVYSSEDEVPQGNPKVIVKAGSVEANLLTLYPTLFGSRPVRVAATPPPGQEIQAEHSQDIGFGVYVVGSKCNYIGADRVATLLQALSGERVR